MSFLPPPTLASSRMPLLRISHLTPPCGFLCLAVLADVEEFYTFCDPTKENLCLYGLSNGSWEVALPSSSEVPPEMLEPALGINFARDGMKRRYGLSLVAIHSEACSSSSPTSTPPISTATTGTCSAKKTATAPRRRRGTREAMWGVRRILSKKSKKGSEQCPMLR
ncbi:hypothetical protein BAE44_0021879 [Dichanthelium oligosanthes]|uniref:PHD finger protein ALFIN-LIKE n=1 Tax=Dichanthelium oligosanthes TaxID=888268 RepID=A0A1E5UVY9_9POAL|nr:hypothetical protein BAE44_0021879 [Dichanthelium oligosanthes]